MKQLWLAIVKVFWLAAEHCRHLDAVSKAIPVKRAKCETCRTLLQPITGRWRGLSTKILFCAVYCPKCGFFEIICEAGEVKLNISDSMKGVSDE